MKWLSSKCLHFVSRGFFASHGFISAFFGLCCSINLRPSLQPNKPQYSGSSLIDKAQDLREWILLSVTDIKITDLSGESWHFLAAGIFQRKSKTVWRNNEFCAKLQRRMQTSLSAMPRCPPVLIFLHGFLKADQNWPWRTMVIVSPVPSKTLQIHPVCCFTYGASASSCSAVLTLILSVHAALSQPENLNAGSRLMINGDHFTGKIEKSTKSLIERRWCEEEKRNFSDVTSERAEHGPLSIHCYSKLACWKRDVFQAECCPTFNRTSSWQEVVIKCEIHKVNATEIKEFCHFVIAEPETNTKQRKLT